MVDYQFRFDVVWSNFGFLISGVGITLYLSAMTMLFGTIIGVVSAVLRLTRIKAISYPITFYVEFFRGTPALVQIVWIYYCLPILTGLQISGLASVIVAMSLNSGAYMSEVFRAGIQGIDKGHREAALSLGMSRTQTFRRIVLPQAAYRMIPTAGNVFVSAIKLSSLASVVGMNELMRQGQSLITYSFRPLEVFTIVAVIYFCMTYTASLVLMYLEYRFAWRKRAKFNWRRAFRLMSRPQGQEI